MRGETPRWGVTATYGRGSVSASANIGGVGVNRRSAEGPSGSKRVPIIR